MTSLKDRKNTFSNIDISSRVPKSKTSFVVIEVYHYDFDVDIAELFLPSNLRSSDETFTTTTIYELREDVANLRINKSINNPSSDFNFTLFPSEDWPSKVSPGDWVVIKMFNNIENEKFVNTKGNKNIVCIGNVDRVAKVIDRNEDDDKIELRYQVSGRGFGKVFEMTNTYFNPYATMPSTLDVFLREKGLPLSGNPTKLVKALLDIFLGDGVSITGLKTKRLKQWSIPSELVQNLGLGNPLYSSQEELFFDSILERDIEEDLPGFKPRQMLGLDSENLWDLIKRSSNDLINECFLELKRSRSGQVQPSIVLRPRPFNTTKFEDIFKKASTGQKVLGYLKGKYKIYQDFAEENFLEISPAEVLYENLGRDDHSKFNLFTLSSVRNEHYFKSPYADSRSGNDINNPTLIRESILRSGLRIMDQSIEFHHVSGESKLNKAEINLWKAWLVQLYDINYANHLNHSGTIECSGVLEAELGKVLTLLPENTSSGSGKKRIYYIEGYEHEWNFPNTWRTVFSLSKGQYKDKTDPYIIFDDTFDSVFKAKTRIVT